MNKKNITLNDCIAWHHAGHLAEAKNGYLSILEQQPNEVMALQCLGLLYVEENQFKEAEECLKKAISLEPDNASSYLHLAHILKFKGSLHEAQDLLLQVIEAHPTLVAAFNQLGNVYFVEGRYKDAIATYQTAIKLKSEDVDAYYNLALAYYKNQQRQEAIRVYQSLLELHPHFDPAHFQLARIMMEQHQYQDALKQFLLIKDHDYHFESLANMAVCCLQLGHLQEAETYYLKALHLESKDSQILFNLGVINAQLGKVSQAITFYLKALEVEPEFYDAHHNVGVAYLMMKHKEAAFRHLHEANRLRPSIAIRHTLNMIAKNENITHIPHEYVRHLFDSYADHYDAHLLQTLHYEVPQHLHHALLEIGLLQKKNLDILDLGCGTGLCGEVLKPMARHLAGLDISSKMLEYAQQKKLYDQLIEREALSFLREHKATFDLILAADMLGYIGELTEIFTGVYQSLQAQSYFIFTVEKEDQKKYLMTDSGRFAYHQDYLDQLSKQTGFNMLYREVITLRTQENSPVSGYLYILDKK